MQTSTPQNAIELLDQRLRSILEDVRLVYLLEREGGWDVTANWEDMLSLGEQQRLGMVCYCPSPKMFSRLCSGNIGAVNKYMYGDCEKIMT